MSYEPLNLKKIKKLIEECARDYEVFGNVRIDATFIDIRDHIKSAVQGLLFDLDDIEYYYFDDDEYILIRKEDVRNLIKKWFVVEE